MSDFRKALMITAIPIVVLSLVTAVGATAGGGGIEGIGWLFSWLIPAFLLLIAFVAAIVFGGKGKKQIASGIWAGVGIGIVSLGLTCFALWQV